MGKRCKQFAQEDIQLINKQKSHKFINWMKNKFKSEEILSEVSAGWKLREETASTTMWEAGKGLLRSAWSCELLLLWGKAIWQHLFNL